MDRRQTCVTGSEVCSGTAAVSGGLHYRRWTVVARKSMRVNEHMVPLRQNEHGNDDTRENVKWLQSSERRSLRPSTPEARAPRKCDTARQLSAQKPHGSRSKSPPVVSALHPVVSAVAERLARCARDLGTEMQLFLSSYSCACDSTRRSRVHRQRIAAQVSASSAKQEPVSEVTREFHTHAKVYWIVLVPPYPSGAAEGGAPPESVAPLQDPFYTPCAYCSSDLKHGGARTAVPASRAARKRGQGGAAFNRDAGESLSRVAGKPRVTDAVKFIPPPDAPV